MEVELTALGSSFLILTETRSDWKSSSKSKSSNLRLMRV